MARILVVEDEESLARGLKFNFQQEGYEVTVAGDGPAALKPYEADDHPFDLIVLDLMLPGMSGYDVCRAIRAKDDWVPILIMTARTLSEDKIQAFDAGTDQYVTKPFALAEVLARVRNLLARRSAVPPDSGKAKPSAPAVYRFDGVVIDFARFTVTVDRGEAVKHEMTTLEAQFLRYLVEHEGTVLARQDILNDVWPADADVTQRTIDNFVLRLRRMIEPDPANPRFLLSVRGTGYRFIATPAD
ncbi:MAG: response regulator transcription factor [Planctomycetota bacterium]|nr:response regulator transcription factor [Planctomycetaceae bacterium]MDQ3331165.1 response regulator transcription factor [Planctomycetota bacterium]